jgi:hypothetical protein
MYNSTDMISLKPYTLSGFEPGPSVSEAGDMSTASCHQGMYVHKNMRKNIRDFGLDKGWSFVPRNTKSEDTWA